MQINLRLACGHTIKSDKRPNPRKVWPDSQLCEVCKKKERVVEIHSMGLPPKNTSRAKTLKKKRRKKK